MIRIDPDSGARTVVSANGNPASSPNFADLFGIANSGGVSDGEEDKNHNGRPDPGEHNPNKAGR